MQAPALLHLLLQAGASSFFAQVTQLQENKKIFSAKSTISTHRLTCRQTKRLDTIGAATGQEVSSAAFTLLSAALR